MTKRTFTLSSQSADEFKKFFETRYAESRSNGMDEEFINALEEESWFGKARSVKTANPGFELVSCMNCDFGLAEECIGFLAFEKKTNESTSDFLFHVGIGECLRPYRVKYEGSDEEKASAAFVDSINH